MDGTLTRGEEMLMRPDEYRVMFEIEDGYWWYRGLRVLLKTLLTRYAPAQPHAAVILDAGCGTGANLRMLQTYGRAIGVDIAVEAIAFCGARGVPRDRALVASVTDLPFRHQLFDLAVSFDVICNIPDDVGAFGEVARALKPGGYCIVGLPAYQWLWSMHDVAVGHQRRYSARDVRAKLARAGLRVVRVTHTNALLLPLVIVQRLLRRRELERGGAIESDLQMDLPRWANAVLSVVYRAEINLATCLDIPFGLSVIAVARKPTSQLTNEQTQP
jgi:SAM-dependent methyltransferase